MPFFVFLATLCAYAQCSGLLRFIIRTHEHIATEDFHGYLFDSPVLPCPPFLYTLVIVVFGAGLAGAGAFLLFPTQLGEGYGAVLSTVQDLEQVLLAKVGMIYAIMSIFIIVAVVLLHLFYSHRIAGPAYRLGREAQVIGQGGLRGISGFVRKTTSRTWLTP